MFQFNFICWMKGCRVVELMELSCVYLIVDERTVLYCCLSVCLSVVSLESCFIFLICLFDCRHQLLDVYSIHTNMSQTVTPITVDQELSESFMSQGMLELNFMPGVIADTTTFTGGLLAAASKATRASDCLLDG